MAVSVNRQIEGNLSRVMGQFDPAGLIRPRSHTGPIRACGLAPRQQAGHMTAIDRPCPARKKTLATRGPSTHDPGIHAFLGAAARRGWPGRARP